MPAPPPSPGTNHRHFEPSPRSKVLFSHRTPFCATNSPALEPRCSSGAPIDNSPRKRSSASFPRSRRVPIHPLLIQKQNARPKCQQHNRDPCANSKTCRLWRAAIMPSPHNHMARNRNQQFQHASFQQTGNYPVHHFRFIPKICIENNAPPHPKTAPGQQNVRLWIDKNPNDVQESLAFHLN